MAYPTAFLVSITSKTGLQEPVTSNLNLNFEGSESIVTTELTNLRKYCLNYVVLKYHLKTKTKNTASDVQTALRNEFLMPNVQQAIQKIVDSGDNAPAKQLTSQLKFKSQQLIKLLFTYFLPVPNLRFRLLTNLLHLAKDFPLSFVFAMVVEYAFQAVFTDAGQAHNILSFLHMIAELNQSLYIIDNVSASRIPEENLLYFAKKNWKKTEKSPYLTNPGSAQGTNQLLVRSIPPPASDRLRRSSSLFQKVSPWKEMVSETSRFLRLYLPFSQELVFERTLKLSFFVRKYLCSLILNTDTLFHAELLVRRLITWHPSFVRAMPLKAFISISKTFFCYLNYKIANPHLGLDRSVHPPGSPGKILEVYLEFCLAYFSSDFHYFQKSDTEYSVTDASTYRKSVEDLHSIFLALIRLTDFRLKDSSFSNSCGVYSFYHRFLAKLSGISCNLNLTTRPWFIGITKRRQVLSVQYVLRGVLYLIKHKIDGLRARMYYNYLNVRVNPLFAGFKLKRQDPEAVFDTVFELNPICALRLKEA